MILAGAGTLQEIESHWSINDLADANEALDVREEAEAYARREAERAQRGRR